MPHPTLVTAWFGSFLCDEKGTVMHERPFPRKASAIASRLEKLEKGEVLHEERALVSENGLKAFSAFDTRLERLGAVIVERRDVDLKGHEYDRALLREAMLELSKKKLRIASPEAHVIHAIKLLDDLAKSSNFFFEGFRAWYGLHFPELEKLVSGEEFASLVSEKGDRESIGLMDGSVGADITDKEKESYMMLAGYVSETGRVKKRLKVYIEDGMAKIAPNLACIAGPLIGARLISHAGTLEKLARMPSSTIQVLGAEKALFRHLKDGSRPPKHGVIFQHPMIHQAPKEKRGRLARALASKISLAAKADFYSKRFIAEQLKKDLEKTCHLVNEEASEFK